MMNKWIGIGNLGADPEIKLSASGTKLAKLRLAVDEYFSRKAEDGSKVANKTTHWVPIIAWGKNAETAETYLQKGSRIAVEGSLRTRTWTDDKGQSHFVMEVHADQLTFLDKIRSVG